MVGGRCWRNVRADRLAVAMRVGVTKADFDRYYRSAS